jgi:hypothetical protein
MKMHLTLAALAALTLTLPQPAAAQASPLRKVDANGVGNCVFSPQELPKGGEGTAPYKAIKSDFNEGESVHIRCYWPKPLSAYRSAGKIYNEIRDKNQYSFALFWMNPGTDGGHSGEYFVQDMASDDASGALGWDQQRFDLYDNNPDCDIKVHDGKLQSDYGVTSPFRCLSLANFARTFPLAQGQKSLRFCFKQYVEVADRTATYTGLDSSDPWRRRTVSTTRNDDYKLVIAQGCFNYHLKG